MNSIKHCRWYGKRVKQKYSSQNVFNLQNNVYFSIKHILIVIIPLKTCADPERAPWVPYPAPWKITKLYDSLAPLENHKAFNVGPCSTRQGKAIRPFKWCFADRPTMAHLKWYWDHQLKKICQSWSRLTPILDAHGGGTYSIFRRRLVCHTFDKRIYVFKQ